MTELYAIPPEFQTSQEYAWAAEPRRTTRIGLWLLALIWGLGTGFSHLTGAPEVVSAGVMAVVGAGLLVIQPTWMVIWIGERAGLLMLGHVIAALLAGIVGGSELSPIVRYLLLLPALSLMLAIARTGGSAVRAAQAGLTLSILVFVVYNAVFMDLGRLGRAQYRLESFMNPNSVGFISAMGAISLLDVFLRRWAGASKRFGTLTVMVLLAILPCFVLCVATKSRTATLVLLVGMALRIYLTIGMTRAMVLVVLGLFALVATWEVVSRLGSGVADLYQLYDRQRAMAGGTGRFRIWATLVTDIFLPNFAIGVGPGNYTPLLKAISGYSLAHNGLLMNAAETGLIGVLPLILIVVMCVRSGWRNRRNREMYFAITLAVAGFVESLAENMFFSMGNPGSLLFLLAVAVLCLQRPDPVDAPSAIGDEPFPAEASI